MLKMLSFCCITALASWSVLANAPAIAIHGGAGTINKSKLTPQKEEAYKAALKEAVNAGYQILQTGGSSVDAVQAAVVSLESTPLFNAGKGAVYTYEGKHELDASIMDGATLNAGSVAGITRVENPIVAARLVMDKSVHVMLSGSGADDFAKAQGLPWVKNSLFDSGFRLKAWKRARKRLQRDTQASLYKNNPNFKYGTVGAVALDKQGNLAAATSTGGMTAKRYGRVGDSPIIGAGNYANNNSCAVSGTGHGEYFIRYQVASDICARVEYQGVSLKQAADHVVKKVLVDADGSGGVIAIDKYGNIAMPFNTQGMYRASVDQKGNLKVAIYGD